MGLCVFLSGGSSRSNKSTKPAFVGPALTPCPLLQGSGCWAGLERLLRRGSGLQRTARVGPAMDCQGRQGYGPCLRLATPSDPPREGSDPASALPSPCKGEGPGMRAALPPTPYTLYPTPYTLYPTQGAGGEGSRRRATSCFCCREFIRPLPKGEGVSCLRRSSARH